MSEEAHEQVSPFIESPRCNTYNSTFVKQPETIGKTIVRCRGHRRSSNMQSTSLDFILQNNDNALNLKKRHSKM